VGKSAFLDNVRRVLNPVVSGLAKAGVTPTQVTLMGLALNVASGVIIGAGRLRAGGLMLIVAGLCDALDGQLARRTGRVSRFGAFLDSTIDRIDETAVLAGIAAYFLRPGGGWNESGEGPAHALGQAGMPHLGPGAWLAIAALVALAGSIITSYARARAEGLGLECKVGLFERTERVVVTILGLLLGRRALIGAVIGLLVLSWFTVLQRIVHVHRVVARLESRPGDAS
jgi:CDP-diacylglycerol--glycerol-3-phosphate 3-phosphatidyltransferase